jgi:hypothetical protein
MVKTRTRASVKEQDTADTILHGDKSTNKHDADGNLVDAEGNRIEWDDSTSWGNFFKSLLHYFFLSLLLGLLGSGFIYLTSRGSELDDILPTEGDFYERNPLGVKVSGPSTDVNCVEVRTGMTEKIINNFPYYMKEEDDLEIFLNKGKDPKTGKGGPGFGKRLKRWFARTVMGCFQINRGLLKSWLDLFEPNTPVGNHTFQIYVGFPFTFFLSNMVPLVTGFGAAAIAAFGADWLLTLIGIVLGWTWIVLIGLTVIIYLRFLVTIILLPLLINWKEIANIMACNVKSIAILFGYFACGAAYNNLDSTISGMMGIVFLIIVLKTFFNYLNNKE